MSIFIYKDGETVPNTAHKLGDISSPRYDLIKRFDFETLTAYEIIHCQYRAQGWYKYGAAKCYVELTDQNPKNRIGPGHNLKISSSNLEDAVELFTLIGEGKILPVRNFEQAQISWPPSNKELLVMAYHNWVARLRTVKRVFTTWWRREIINMAKAKVKNS